METPPQTIPAVVLDTNVVLDWLVFRDPSSRAVTAAIRDARVRWIATTAMRNELEHVLTLQKILSWQPDRAGVLGDWDRWATPVEAPALTLQRGLRCTDPDDQKFIDLALQAGASMLLSRDRAVLKLAARARRCGLLIQSPAAWV